MGPAWLASETVKWWVNTLALPVALAVATIVYQYAAADRVATEGRDKLYTELLSKREEAEADVRRNVFEKVLGTALIPAQGDMEQRIVALELLALNFHESINLSPLYWQLARQIADEPSERRDRYTKQLERIAENVKARQIELLDVFGAKREATIIFAEVARTNLLSPLISDKLTFKDPDVRGPQPEFERQFDVEVVDHDAVLRRLLVRVHDGKKQWTLWVDQFDFPLVDFVRISRWERFAVILGSYTADSASLRFLYFPSSRGGVKDKPFIDDVISGLRK